MASDPSMSGSDSQAEHPFLSWLCEGVELGKLFADSLVKVPLSRPSLDRLECDCITSQVELAGKSPVEQATMKRVSLPL